MNPARSVAPDLLRGDLSTTWIYILGPLSGATIGVAFEWILQGPPTNRGLTQRKAKKPVSPRVDDTDLKAPSPLR